MNPPKKAIVSDSGMEATPRNPFGDAMSSDYKQFASQYPTRSLTEFREPKSEIGVNEVLYDTIDKQVVEPYNSNHPLDRSRYMVYYQPVPVAKENTITSYSENPNNSNSLEEAAERYIKETQPDSKYNCRVDFIAGANHIIQSGEYVPINLVEKALRRALYGYAQDYIDAMVKASLDVLTTLKNNK